MKAFLSHVEKEYLAYFSTAFLRGMRPNELIALKWLNVDFEMRVVTVREGRVQGVEGAPKTLSSYRDIDMVDPLFAVLSKHRQESALDAKYVFTGRKGKPLEVNNVRNRIWYPTLAKAGLRRRTMYQTRHTFASLMLSYGEDPLWVARMFGHTSTEMLYRHYGKFIRNRMRRDGMRFLRGFQEAEVASALPSAPEIVKIGVAATAATANAVESSRSLSKDFGHSLDTGGVSGMKIGAAEDRNPLIELVAGPGFEPGFFGL